jgi:hypothetical protein
LGYFHVSGRGLAMFKTYDEEGNETTELKDHLLTSSTVETRSLVVAEWNLNEIENIEEIGNYRYRPTDEASDFYELPETFTKETAYSPTAKYYGATDADIVFDGGSDVDEEPVFVTKQNKRNKFYYSLEDCFGRFRPRSGINKAIFGVGPLDKFGHFLTNNFAKRPRYYVASKNDVFKYWTSYRTEVVDNKSFNRGLSYSFNNGNTYYIDDAVPFVVYKEEFAANRIIIKMQTHVGDATVPATPNDPFTGPASVPKNWKVDVLDSSDNWSTAITMNDYTIRKDGYVELVYGPVIPAEHQETFVYVGEYSDVESIPTQSIDGYTYLVDDTYYIWKQEFLSYDTFSATPAWQVTEDLIERVKPFVTDLVSASSTANSYEIIKGIRVAVTSMNKRQMPFDLIEISPRLCADLSDKTVDFSIEKKGGDLSETGIPSGDILASTGNISIFDYDQAFDKDNSNSIIKNSSFKNLQFKFYQKILNVNGFDYTIPIKTMYVDGFPQTNYAERTLDISLRDLFFYFESVTSPTVFLRNKSLKYILAFLLDSVGYSNYDFKSVSEERNIIIPNFFVGPDKSLAELLQDIAVSTQSSMFFDEENNLIIMSKEYIMPASRSTDIVLSGSPDQTRDRVYDNKTTLGNGVTQISNIIQIQAESHEIYNAGKVLFSNRYIQKNVSDLDQYGKLDYEKVFTYQPVLLWELSSKNAEENKANDQSNNQNYTLSAVTLNSEIPSTPPYIENNEVKGNTFDIGEMVYFLNNYSGYFMANGEIIKYDAKQYSVSSLGKYEAKVWVSSESDKDYYFSQVKYGSKMKPTGLVRIYAEVSYDENGDLDEIVKHGRGQFGTSIVGHSAGIKPSWRTQRGAAAMDFDYLIGKKSYADLSSVLTSPGLLTTTINNTSTTINVPAGKGFPVSVSLGVPSYYEDSLDFSSVNGIIANYISNSYVSDIEYKVSTKNIVGTVQSSALVFTGNKTYDRAETINFLSYSYTKLDSAPTNIGTRMRVMGSQTTNKNMSQMPFGEMTYLNTSAQIDDKAETLSISGGSGGIAIHVNERSNSGYYFEIAALSTYLAENDSNVWFYKLNRKSFPNLVDTTATALGAVNDSNSPNILKAASNGALSSKLRDRATNGAVAGLAVGDRVYISKQTNSYQNGYFKITKLGGVSSKWEMERDELAVPRVLFQAKADILVDSTNMVGSSRIVPGDKTPVYDLRVETKREGQGLRFLLYINNVYIGEAFDEDVSQTKITNTIAVFVRGTSKCMFEHVYAISNNPEYINPSNIVDEFSSLREDIRNATNKINEQTGGDTTDIYNNIKNYGINRTIISEYLSKMKTTGFEKNVFYDEFGTILRECAYFNVRYDKAYPAVTAKVSTNNNPLLGYYVSNFIATPYGAEFMLFNTTDAPLVMDSSNSNYFTIIGTTFTAESNEEVTVDDYFDFVSDYSQYYSNLPANSSNIQNDLITIKNSRSMYGKKEFSIEAPYIQDRDTATEMMGWMIQKIKKPKLAVSLELFSLPIIQIGDIVQIEYQANNNVDIPATSRFVVYAADVSASSGEISQKIYLSEVV